MCGIAGIFARAQQAGPVSGPELQKIRDEMVQRGPDGAGLWLDEIGRIGLAHRRLAIIDLSDAGQQPMHSRDGRYSIVFNGEIYNFQELRAELAKRGVRFTSQTDTEVILELFRDLGANCVTKLRGMFAFAIWDSLERRLFLARDPFGIKPLYFSHDGLSFRFASQVRALINSGAVSGEIDVASKAAFYLWGAVPGPDTIYLKIKELPAGTWMYVSAAGVGEPTAYFNVADVFAEAENCAAQLGEPIDETVAALRDSVHAHMVSDVPVGLFLSAGIDSNLIASFSRGCTPYQIRAITLAFLEYANSIDDEVPLASMSAHKFGLNHIVRYADRAEFSEERGKLARAMDQPTTDGVNSYFISKVAAEAKIKVALSGLGSDEIFAGYPSFRQIPRLVRVGGAMPGFRLLGGGVRRAVSPFLPERLVSPKYAGILEQSGDFFSAYMLRRALFMPWELPIKLDRSQANSVRERFELLRSRAAQDLGKIRNEQLKVSYLELTLYMRNQLLRDTDWASMSHSLEVRVPFLDVTLLRTAARAIGQVGQLDKRTIAAHPSAELPLLIARRPKTGFSVPIREWLGTTARGARGLRGWAREVVRRWPAEKPARIAVLATDAYGGIGGIAKFNRDLLRALAEAPECQSIEVVPRIIKTDLEPIPPKVVFHDRASRSKLRFLWTALVELIPTRLDVIVCGHINLLPLAIALGLVKRTEVVLVVHGIDAWERHPSALVRFALPRVDRVIAVSSFTVSRMQAWAGLPEAKFSVLPNCVELSKFHASSPSEEVRRRHRLDGNTILITVGRLVSKERLKGFDEVLRAIPHLITEFPDLHYLIVGDGDDKGRLEALAVSLGIKSRVTFAGYIAEEEKQAYYSVAKAFVMPSRGEGFGIVYLEALACGLPVLGSSSDGSRDALLGGRFGLLVDPSDHLQVIEGIRSVLVNGKRVQPAELEFFSYETFRDRVRATFFGSRAQVYDLRSVS